MDCAHFIGGMLQQRYPDAERVVLVMDCPEHARDRVAVCDLRAEAGAARALGNPLHAQAWQLAQHCRNQVERAVGSMLEVMHPRHRGNAQRDHIFGTESKQPPIRGELVLQHVRRPRQDQKPIPEYLRGTSY